MLKQYLELTKPERTLANVITAAAGYLLASQWHIHAWLFLAMLGGISLVVASACVLNNYIDQGIDAKMPRTRKRALVQKRILARHALVYGLLLGVIGFGLLWRYVNALVVLLGAVAYLDYIVLYGYTKRHSVHATLVGTVSGAMPIVAGYCAVTDRIDGSAITLFLAMTFWQMSHFFAIAIFRLKDYAAAHIPVLPVQRGIPRTRVQVLVYCILFTVTALGLSIFGNAGYVYAVVIAVVGGFWLWHGVRGFTSADQVLWARKMFFVSLKVLLVFSAMVAIGSILP